MTERLPGDREQAFWSGVAEASRFFMGDSDVQRALERLARTLDEFDELWLAAQTPDRE